MVYLAESPAAVLLEQLVQNNVGQGATPRGYRLLAIDIDDGVAREQVSADDLPAAWRTDPTATRRIGDAWLDGARALLLIVPSAVAPFTRNALLNPAHPDAARAAIVEAHDLVLDPRLAPGR